MKTKRTNFGGQVGTSGLRDSRACLKRYNPEYAMSALR